MAKKDLQLTDAIDENLKLVRDSDGVDTPLELSTEKVRVTGDLEATGYTDNIKLREEAIIKADGNVTLDSAGDISLDADGGEVYLKDGGASFGALSTAASASSLVLYENGGASTDDSLTISVAANGQTAIATNDDAGSDADLLIKADGDLSFNSITGKFKAIKGLQEFSATDSAYAGMMLGCTHIFGSGTGGVFVQISTAWENLLWDTDKFALVTFVVPPSNRVKISVHLPFVQASGVAIGLGLATDSSATTLGTKYENDVDDANRPDNFNINYSWVVEGSDHSWSAGETKTIYIMAYAASVMRFYTGGTNTSGYGGVIVEATALPATIGDGSEP